MPVNEKEPQIKKESEYHYPVAVGTSFFNGEGNLRPDSYLRIFTDVADQHVRSFQANNGWLMEKFGVAWVLLSTEIHLLGKVRQNEILTATTWCTGWRHGMYGRDMVLAGEDGKPVIGVGSLWTLLDVKKREIYKGEEAAKAMVLMEEPSNYPGTKARFKTKNYDLTETEERRIPASYIDASGHVNNARYGEFLYDNLSAEKRGKLGKLDRLEFYFHGELEEGDLLQIRKWEGEKEVLVTGGKDGQEAFAARIVWE